MNLKYKNELLKLKDIEIGTKIDDNMNEFNKKKVIVINKLVLKLGQ